MVNTERVDAAKRVVALAISATLYIASLLLPAINDPLSQLSGSNEDSASLSGFEVLRSAWEWPLTIHWSANIYYAIAFVLLGLGLPRPAIFTATGGIIFAASALLSFNPSTFGSGYIVWVLAGVVLAIGSWFGGGSRREPDVIWALSETDNLGADIKD